MIRIIINADDLGKDHATNIAIEEALREKDITSSTIMANSTTWDDVHRIVNDNPNASFGIHLNLSEGKALTNNPILLKEGIVDKDYCFTQKARKLSTINENLEEVIFEEWDLQIMTVLKEQNIPITHLDGHHHIHMNAVYSRILKQLIDKYNIHWVRRKHNLWKPIPAKEKIKNIAFSLVSRMPLPLDNSSSIGLRLNNKIKDFTWIDFLNESTKFTDYFNGYEQAVEAIESNCYPPDNTVIELMCHPGHTSFKKEFDMVREHRVEKILQETLLCSYKTLV